MDQSSITINYRAAIALNNIGTSLLRKGMPVAAFQAFKDAIALMESLRTSSGQGPTRSWTWAQERVQVAASSLCKQDMFKKSSDLREVIYEQRQTLASIDFTSQNETIYVVRIELEYGLSPCLFEYDFLAETSIMIYNLAMTTLCRVILVGKDPSIEMRNRVSRARMVESAIRQFGFVRQLLEPLLCGDSGDEVDEESDLFATQLDSLVLRQLLLLHTLQNGANEGNREVGYHHLNAQLRRNSEYLEEYGECTVFSKQKISAAAA